MTKVKILGRDVHGLKVTHAEIEHNERFYRWHRKWGVCVWIARPVSNEMGHGDGFWRKTTGKHAVRFVETTLNVNTEKPTQAKS